jgi:lactoylglutathione lyase
MARIEHIALWVEDLAALSAFYASTFGAQVGPRYVNAAKGFESCFLTFESGARVELMTTTRLSPVRHAHGTDAPRDFSRL